MADKKINMLSNKKIKILQERFQELAIVDRQLIALKIICNDYPSWRGSEKKLIDKIIQSGIRDTNGKIFTSNFYQARVAHFKQIGLASNQPELTIPKELHHDLLVTMPEVETQWVFNMVNQLYSSSIPDFSELYTQRGYFQENKAQIRACIQKAIYANEPDYFLAHSDNIIYCNKLFAYLVDILGKNVVNIAWLGSRHAIIQLFICTALLRSYYCEQKPHPSTKEIFAFFVQQHFDAIHHDYLQYYSAIIYLSTGQMDRFLQISTLIKNQKSGFWLSLQATSAFLSSKFELASTSYKKALSAFKKQYGTRSYYFDNILGIFHCLCLVYIDKDLIQINVNRVQFEKYAENGLAMPMHVSYALLLIIVQIEQGDQKTAKRWLQDFEKQKLNHPFPLTIYQLLNYMLDKSYVNTNSVRLCTQIKQYIQENQLIMAHILCELLGKAEIKHTEPSTFLKNSMLRFQILELINVKDAWEYSFQALEGLLLETREGVTIPAKTRRLLWLFDPDKMVVDVIEQCVNKSGKWSTGRALNLGRLKNHHYDEHFNYLTTADKKAINDIVEEADGWRYSYYRFDTPKILLALIGHPNIAHYQNRDVAIELISREPELHIEENKTEYKLSLSHWLESTGLILEPESPNKYCVIYFSPAFANIGQILTKKGLSIPKLAKDKVLKIIQNAKRDIKIQVGIKDIAIPEIAGDATPCIQLLPMKSGIRATLWVRPSISHGAYYKIGQGNERIMTFLTENGKETRAHIMRNFIQEKNNQHHLLSHCQSLAHQEYDQGEYETENPEDTLEVLSELQQYAISHPLTL